MHALAVGQRTKPMVVGRSAAEREGGCVLLTRGESMPAGCVGSGGDPEGRVGGAGGSGAELGEVRKPGVTGAFAGVGRLCRRYIPTGFSSPLGRVAALAGALAWLG